MANVRSALIESRIKTLVEMLGKKHPPVAVLELLALHRRYDYRGMLAVIKLQMRLNMPLRVCYVNDPNYGPKDSAAWVSDLSYVPIFGCSPDSTLMASVYLRRSTLCEMPFSALVFAIAHELAHILLKALRSPLYDDEVATDLTAMLLGYGTCYAAGKIYPEPLNAFNFLLPEIRGNTSGYLSHEEIIFAESIIRM